MTYRALSTPLHDNVEINFDLTISKRQKNLAAFIEILQKRQISSKITKKYIICEGVRLIHITIIVKHGKYFLTFPNSQFYIKNYS